MSDRLLVATRKGLFTLTRQRAGWTANLIGFVGNPVTNVLRQADGVMFAALKLGHFGPKLHRSDDDGRTWREIAAPAFAADTPGEPSLFQIWSLEGGGPHHPNRLWIGAIPPGLFRSDDRGESWQLMNSLWNVPDRARWFGGGYDDAGIHSVLIHPENPDHVTVGISCGGVWQSADRGKSWSAKTEGMFAAYVPPEQRNDSAVQDPHRVVHCGSSPDTLWVQHHNGVFHSTDGAANWNELSPPVSNFGFAVAAHPKDSLTAWFVPAHSDQRREPVNAKLVVNRTRNGGKSFET